MKRLAFLLALTFAFSSCATPTMIPTAPGTPAPDTKPAPATATIVPTETSIPVPPTEAGPKEGDTKVETINGATDTFTYHDEMSQDGKEIIGLFKPAGNFPFYDLSSEYLPNGNGGWVPGKGFIPTSIYIGDKVDGEEAIQAFIHPAGPALGSSLSQVSDYTTFVDSAIFNHYFDKPLFRPISVTDQQTSDYIKALEAGNISYTFNIGSKEEGWSSEMSDYVFS